VPTPVGSVLIRAVGPLGRRIPTEDAVRVVDREVSADRGEAAVEHRMVQRDVRCAVPAHGEADQRASFRGSPVRSLHRGDERPDDEALQPIPAVAGVRPFGVGPGAVAVRRSHHEGTSGIGKPCGLGHDATGDGVIGTAGHSVQEVHHRQRDIVRHRWPVDQHLPAMAPVGHGDGPDRRRHGGTGQPGTGIGHQPTGEEEEDRHKGEQPPSPPGRPCLRHRSSVRWGKLAGDHFRAGRRRPRRSC
jgi:hypothetical protein